MRSWPLPRRRPERNRRIERFLDTPVKRYSSGMYVRLAFAVAAHLELEILLVDEVLGSQIEAEIGMARSEVKEARYERSGYCAAPAMGVVYA
jgi:energy-coupling factor transporter ATP-binding protein EcfA2